MLSTNPSHSKPEPIILVFEGMPKKAMEEINDDLGRIFRGTKYEDHYFITDRMVKGVENPYTDKLDKIIDLLSKINERQILKDD